MAPSAPCFIAFTLSLGSAAQAFLAPHPAGTLLRPRSGAGVAPARAPLPGAVRAPRARGHGLFGLRAVTESRKPILITGNNLELTEPLMDYVNKKVEKSLEKVGGNVSKVDVHLSVNKNPRISAGHIAEVTVFAKGTVIRASEASESMYASIDLVSDRITRKLRKYKERKLTAKRHRESISEAVGRVEEEVNQEIFGDADVDTEDEGEDEYDNPEPKVDMSIVKHKSFPMPAQSVADAVICLDYIDHDFYVFRNVATDEVNVVYKRNSGGVGHIEPERD